MTHPLWTSQEIVTATNGEVTGSFEASGVSIDTRSLQPGDLFVALLADRDGHEFVEEAFARGASGALVERAIVDRPCIVVPHALTALEQIGAAARDRSPSKRIGVTGSVGKTSVKDALAHIFGRAGNAHHSVASYNNHWGVPLTLARMPHKTERAVFEMGMNAAGEIRALTAQVKPCIAIITRIGEAHLEKLGTVEAIARAKAEIFEGLSEWGAAIMPGEGPYSDLLAEQAGAAGAGWLVRFGHERHFEARGLGVEAGANGRPVLKADVFGSEMRLPLPSAADHWVMNGLAIAAAAYLADVPRDLIEAAMGEVGLTPGRGRVETFALGDGAVTLIDDSYNANPTSMAASLETLARFGGRTIAALGEMRELCDAAPAKHHAMGRLADRLGLSRVHVAGSAARPLYDAVTPERRGVFATSSTDLVAAILEDLRPGDVVLVKGSNAMAMNTITEAVRARFSQRE
jgi:UDP-N-acetylmuramoyl-tripeptide--D-alanyl-D-alanine ligase